jgi:hypothetical protein
MDKMIVMDKSDRLSGITRIPTITQTQTPLLAGKEVGVRTQINTCRIADMCVNREEHWQQIAQPGQPGVFQQDQTPLLVVKVISSNESEDYGQKYREYGAISIPEYWIVNQKRGQIQVCNLAYPDAHPGGPYTHQVFELGQRIGSQVLPQLNLTVDAVLNPTLVKHLIEQECTQQAAQQTVLEQERDALKLELERLKALIKPE